MCGGTGAGVRSRRVVLPCIIMSQLELESGHRCVWFKVQWDNVPS